MAKVEALKRLLCAIKNDGTTPDQIGGSDVSEVLKNFILYYNGDVGEFVPLNLKSEPGEVSGTTYISVDVDTHNITDDSYVVLAYKTGGKLELPAYHEQLDPMSWESWDGTSLLRIDDGLQICVVLSSDRGQIIRAGITTVHSNITGHPQPHYTQRSAKR